MKQNDFKKNVLNLIYLLSCAVNNKNPDKKLCSEMNIEEIYNLSRLHSLTTCTAYALEKIMPLPKSFHQGRSKAIGKQVMYEIEREKVFYALEANGIWYVPLKGIIIKNYYPKPTMREMSDNDILFDSSKTAELKRLMEELDFSCISYGRGHHDVFKKPPFINFEMHTSLFNKKTRPDFYEYFKDINDRLIRCDNKKSEYRFSDEDFYIFHICHLYKHYSASGIGLRSLLDVYVFLQNHLDSLDLAYLKREFKKLNLDDFEVHIRNLSKKAFSQQELSEKENEEILFFAESNSHGTSENTLAIKLRNDDSKKSKFRYIISRFFPNGDYLKKTYPVVYRNRVLYPFLVIARPVIAIFKKRTKIALEFDELKKFKKKETLGKYN